jgi:hypothetical protein
MGRLDPLEFIFIKNYLGRLYRKFPNVRDNFEYLVAQHGLNIDLMLNKYEPDIQENVLLMEEDDYIINPHLLNKHVDDFFNNGYDILGVGRGSATPYLLDSLCPMVKNRPGLQIDTEIRPDDSAISFWPTLFLAKKKFMVNSSRQFHSTTWPSGSVIKMGDKELVLDRECSGDTFVNYSFELYNNPEVKKVRLLSNTPENINDKHIRRTYHSSLHDNELLDDITDTSVDFHVGSMSTVISNRFWKPYTGKLYEHSYIPSMRAQKLKEPTTWNNLEIVEPYRRCLLLREMLHAIKDPKDFEFYDLYEENLGRTIEMYESENDMISILRSYNIHQLSDGISTEKYGLIAKKIL